MVETTDENGNEVKEAFAGRDFEKRFFAEHTNQILCRTLLQHGLHDPISGEFGKTIAFAVSQNHAAKITQILNELADQLWPGRYNSDFAMQVTSHVADAQRMTINFANNNLGGHSAILPDYRTCKARVCVTVGMMTTGYDCPDLLNLALMRPVFSPLDFVQIKGRGTRKHNFAEEMFDPARKAELLDTETKRRIDTCRDILVGKVPDPKSQVEQITVALIYKFMDDMDLEAEELGGERKFFTSDYERYRWAKLVAPGVSGQDMLNTYSEALTKMVENAGLPLLFRNIFRNAYLPYRDPETLRAFLREINSFTYDHS